MVNDKITNFVQDVCDALQITPPQICFDTSHFESDTMMAQCISTGDAIYISETDSPNPDYYFAIAHELRHIWQIRNHYDAFLAEYKTRNQCDSLEEYNLQPAEVDANAFGQIVMVELFHITPLWRGFSNKVKLAIKRRVKQIAAEME